MNDNVNNDGVDAQAADMAVAMAEAGDNVQDIVAFVAQTPGATAALIKKQFKMSREQWDVSRSTETFKKAVRTEGQKRGTRYYPRNNNG